MREKAKEYQKAVNATGERIGFETALEEVRLAYERTRKATDEGYNAPTS